MIDEISFKILKILQEKARIPNVEVARQVGMAPSAVLERIRKLESQGLIDGYEVRLNPKRFGKSLVAFVRVRTAARAENEKIARALSDIPEVQEVHFVTGEDGYLLKIRASDATELNHIVREKICAIEGVTDTATSVALSTYKETAQIPIGEKPWQE